MKIDFDKYENGLVPAIIQDVRTKNVLMLGFMNLEAYEKTLALKKVTFLAVLKGDFGLKVKRLKTIYILKILR